MTSRKENSEQSLIAILGATLSGAAAFQRVPNPQPATVPQTAP